MIKKVAIFIILFLLCMQNTSAAIDDMELALLQPYINKQTLRWDNIAAKPFWLNVEKPIYFPQWKMQGIRLQETKPSKFNKSESLTFWQTLGSDFLAGLDHASQLFELSSSSDSPLSAPMNDENINDKPNSVASSNSHLQQSANQFYRFYLSAYQHFRLYNPNQQLQAEDIAIYLSNGTGLLARAKVQKSSDGHSLIVSAKSSHPLIVHVSRSNSFTENIDLAVFVSRQEPINAIAPYRLLKYLSGNTVWLAKTPLQIPQLYWQLNAFKQESISVEGPARIMLKNRLKYEQDATQFRQDYRIRYQLGNSPSSWLNFSTEAESRLNIFVNNKNKTLAQEQQAFIEIPAGHHLLQLMSDRNLLLQVLEQSENDYLLPGLNQPLLPMKTVRKQELLSEHELSKANRSAQVLVRDNNSKSSALIGQQLLKQSAFQNISFSPGLKEAKKIVGQATFYRNLLPGIKHSHADQFNAYFINRRLEKSEHQQHDVIIAEQHQSAALNRLGNAYFSPITKSPDSFFLPERKVPTQLRILVDNRKCQQRKFSVQMDQQPPRLFILQCQNNAINKKRFIHSSPETALLKLQEVTPESDNITLEPLFSSYRRPRGLITTASYEIDLPEQVQKLKIKCLNNDPCSINLALQIRVAKTNQFSEQSYLAQLHDKSETHLLKLLSDYVNDADKYTDATEDQLKNQWMPIKRLLTKLNKTFKSSIPSKIPVHTLADSSELQNWRNLALQAEKKAQWNDALSHWNRIVESSNGKNRDQAQVAQAIILSNLSETYLARSLWQYIILNADPLFAKEAKKQLLTMYRQQQDKAAIQKLATTLYIQQADQQSLGFLLESLIDNEQYRFALLLGLNLKEPPLEAMLKAAYKLNWWQSYDLFLSRLEAPRKAFWVGLKAQKNHHYATALKSWDEAKLSNWSKHLREGFLIQQQMSDNSDKVQIYRRWQQWQKNHPGGFIWDDAARLVKDAAGVDQFYVQDRDLYIKAYRATQQRPLKIRVLGPTKLNFRVRPLHNIPDSQLDGILNISDNKKQYRLPFFNNRVSPSLIIIGEENHLSGNLISMEYQVGEGVHEIELFSDHSPLSIAINEQNPEFALTILAPLQLDTLAHALAISEPSVKKLISAKPSLSNRIADADLTPKMLSQLPETNNAAQAESRMLQTLYLLKKSTKKRARLLFFAEKLQQQFPQNYALQQLWHQISRYSEWQPVTSIMSKGGIRFVDTQGWQPSNPVLQRRKALINTINIDEHVVFSDQRLVLVMNNITGRELKIEARLDDILFLAENPAQFAYQIDQQDPQSIEILRAQNSKEIILKIPAGQHKIRFWLSKSVTNQYLKLRFKDHVSDLKLAKERSFFLSTQQDPLQIHIHGPAMIRIDEWLDNKINSHYQQVADGWQLLTLPPNNRQQESLFLVKQRLVSEKQRPARIRVIKQKITKIDESSIQLRQVITPEIVELDDFFELGHQQDGTWSFGSSLVRRNNVQEDFDRGNSEDFQQFTVNHRYFDSYRNLYWDSKGFIRARKKGGPTLGLSESVQIRNDNHPFIINFEAKILSQVVHKDPEWLGQFKLDIAQSAKITPQTSIYPKLSWFGRYLSLRGNNTEMEDSIFKQKMDQDIFTRYKSDHTTGLSASLLFTHDPWLDTRWTAKIKTVSNENMNFFIPDHFSTEAHWKQLMGNVSLDAAYRISFFQNDNDRSRSIKRHATKLKLTWQVWTNKMNRFEVSSQYQYDIDRKAHLGMLSFSYHLGVGRKYRDFKPGKIDFRHIRERQSLNE